MPPLADLPKARVVVIGDYMIDRWVYGRVERISPEAPVPVFIWDDEEEMPGGAGNVVQNLIALGANPVEFFVPEGAKSVKTRYVVNGQQIFRVDQDRFFTPDIGKIVAQLSGFDVLVISDYAKGVCTPELCQRLIGWAREHGCKVVVDPKGDDWSKYRGAYVITPNDAEARPLNGQPFFSDAVLVTMGGKGMRLIEPEKERIDIPATAREVFDVTGAGDTVVAVLAAALAVGFDLPEAARMANAAAGVVVGKRGTATCSLEELKCALG